MSMLTEALKTHPVVYVTRDIERALGLPLDTPGYYSITNSTPFAKAASAGRDNVLLIESAELLDTHELLGHPKTIEFIDQLSEKNIIVFKNTPVIEKICAEQNWQVLNPSAQLAATIEEKISQIEWLDDLQKFLPEHQIHVLKEVWFDGTPFMLQFNRAHTGSGTILIDNKKILDELIATFPDRPVRVSSYLKGMMCTSNNVVIPEGLLFGNPSYQITGLPPFTDKPFATIGNDWSFGSDVMAAPDEKFQVAEQYLEIVEQVGRKLLASGWRGLFGVDCLVTDDNKVYLIEINARQPASTTYESVLQQENQQKSDYTLGERGLTTFAAHLASLMGATNPGHRIIDVVDGAQIIVRNQEGKTWPDARLAAIEEKLKQENFNVVRYTNTAPGSDLLRIQCRRGIMAGHNEFNDLGKKIYGTINA